MLLRFFLKKIIFFSLFCDSIDVKSKMFIFPPLQFFKQLLFSMHFYFQEKFKISLICFLFCFSSLWIFSNCNSPLFYLISPSLFNRFVIVCLYFFPQNTKDRTLWKNPTLYKSIVVVDSPPVITIFLVGFVYIYGVNLKYTFWLVF